MLVKGTVAVYMKSESGDNYLYCFENVSLEDIAKELREDMDWFRPLCDYKTTGNNEDFVSGVKTLLETIYEESWERNDE